MNTMISFSQDNSRVILTAIDDFTPSCLYDDLSREPSSCFLVFDNDLMLSWLNVA